jgi:hypothetical protein
MRDTPIASKRLSARRQPAARKGRLEPPVGRGRQPLFEAEGLSNGIGSVSHGEITGLIL